MSWLPEEGEPCREVETTDDVTWTDKMVRAQIHSTRLIREKVGCASGDLRSAKSDLKGRSSDVRRLTRRKPTCSKRRVGEEKLKADPRRLALSMRETKAREGEHALDKTNQRGDTQFARGLIYSVSGVFSARFHHIRAKFVELHVSVRVLMFFSNGKRRSAAACGGACGGAWRRVLCFSGCVRQFSMQWWLSSRDSRWHSQNMR